MTHGSIGALIKLWAEDSWNGLRWRAPRTQFPNQCRPNWLGPSLRGSGSARTRMRGSSMTVKFPA